MPSRSLTLTAAAFLITIFTSGSNSQPEVFPHPLSPRIANYDIDVKLDPAKRLLNGKELVRWHNKTTDYIRELQFHLYLNAFRNNRSTFMKESAGSSRGFKMDVDGWGFIEINSIKTISGDEIKGSIQFVQPDDGNSEDKTVFRLPLGQPVPPGDSVILYIDFTALLPQPPFARTGAKDEYFFVGQWFPKVGVYTDGKWNCHQYHANSEFFSDFGNYNVRINVPEKNILGATGILVEKKSNNDGTATHFYRAEDVHDFAWTTSPDFVEFTGQAQDVSIRVLMQRDRAYQGERHLEAAKIAVEYFQNWYGDYPYPNLTVVDPRRGAGGSGGMEYPTLITAGSTYGLPEGIRMVEMVIIHEFGHNYWYHLLASNEFEESWMDEGINTYSENQVFESAYGTDGNMIDFLGLKINDQQFQRAQYMSFASVDSTVRSAWRYYSGASYAINSYMKPGLFLATLQNYVGKETMLKIMRTYSEKWRFKHPKSQDFIDVANEIYSQSHPQPHDEPKYAKTMAMDSAASKVSGANLDWFFKQALYSNAVLDYSVDKISSNQAPKEDGFDYSVNMQDAINGSLKKSDADEEDSVKVYINEVKLRRLGEFKFPVEVEMVFDNGEKIREKWDGQDLWTKFRYIKTSKIVSAQIDPDHLIPLDVNLTNNSKTVESRMLGANKLAVRFLFWVQFLLDMPEFLNIFTFITSIF